ncbi:ABC transporter substrate-binding protein [Agrobacterium tumefaciens]|uniref:Thiamine pyrimidine synthase n=4 Tax=Rhizobiaceae TaxID=82115 RepID=A0A546XJ60_AGRTU|nr:ABC transporter substrate-binding protein [Rhizobium sp. MJ21]MEB3046161.1 ABC transporter substrate-binding protein [Rhizobium sp. MJ21]TRB00786.1 ABC transporter substrate-binding protein [Agrobacterium tumefaciens]WHO11661.1 ABC transporter substrate-binding protein [Agrobacterium cucumeris]
MKLGGNPLKISRRAFLGFSIGMVAAPAIGRPQGLQPLSARMDFAPWGVQAAMHLCQVKGWFKDVGLEVDVQDGRGSGNTLQLVNAGQVDVGQVQLGLVPQARVKSALVKGIAGFGRATDLAAVVDRDSDYKTVADFKGKSIVCFAASPWAPFIDFWLAQGGLDRSTVELLLVDPAALWSTYTTRRADVILSTGPSIIPPAEAVRPSRGILASDAGVNFPSYGLIASDATISKRGDALKALVASQQKAWAYLRDGNAAEGAEAMIQQRPNAKLIKDVLIRQIDMTIETFNTEATKGKLIGWQAEEDWQAALGTMEKASAIPSGLALSDIFTNEFIG